MTTPQPTNNPRQQHATADSNEAIFSRARACGLYTGPAPETLPSVPQHRLNELLRSLQPVTEILARSYRLECSIEPLYYPATSEVELIRFQRDHEELMPESATPEGYAYIGHGTCVSFRVVDRLSGSTSYTGSTRVFAALPQSLLERVTGAHCDHVGTMYSYDIVDAYIPVSTDLSDTLSEGSCRSGAPTTAPCDPEDRL